MNKRDAEFDDWYSVLQMHVLDNTGIEFRDEEAVREDYDAGKDVFDVIDEITAEYISSP